MSSLAIRITPETLRSLAFGSISGAYMGIGTPFIAPSRIFHVQNLTDVQMTFSLDGITDHFVLPSQGFLLLDLTANKTNAQGAFIAEGVRVYVKESAGAPTSGSVYVTSF